MRLFFAVAIPADIRTGIRERIRAARCPESLRLTPPDSFHLTLAFLGDVDEKRLADIEAVGVRCQDQPGFQLTVGGAGFFPSPARARVAWLDIQGQPERVVSLAAALQRRLSEAGFPGEERTYSPHLTVARVRADARLPRPEAEQFRAAVGDYRSRPFDVKEIHLYRSHLGAAGSRYEIIASFPLA